MKPKIHVLPESLSNLIAAGEVVERPASIVKELIENSIDAHASQIDIEIKDAGCTSIRIGDNGQGMIPEDAKLAFFRHATSKLSTPDDLNHISTMGFRGEALASIAAVSKVELKTCLPKSVSGYELKLEAGRVVSEKEIGCASGTTIIVKDLFFNTPARKKFLKSTTTEQAHITQLIELFAISNSGIAFNYKVDGRLLIQCPITDKLEERLAALYQKALPPELIPVEREGGGVWITGLIGGPGSVKPNRQSIRLFMNGRIIEHRALTHAVVQAYKTLIPEGKFPVAYLFMQLSPDLVDVNVHPSKREVKFQDEQAMYQLMLKAVKEALDQADLTTQESNRYLQSANINQPQQQTTNYRKQAFEFNVNEPKKWSPQRVKESVANYYQSQSSKSGSFNQSVAKTDVESAVSSRIIGQMGKMFIVGEDEEGFFIVDQHAAHERILYEQLKQDQHKKNDRQPLLLPLTFEVTPSQQPILEKLLPFFDEMGLEISPMGGTTFTIQTQPTSIETRDLIGVVMEVLSEATESGTLPDLNQLNDQLLISLACHSAIKSGDRLQPETMEQLISQLKQIKHLPTCPHGRPTMFRLSWNELQKYFKRDYQ